MVIRFIKVISIFSLISLCIAACSYYSGDKGGNSKNYTTLSDSKNSGPRMYGSKQTGGIVIHNNKELYYSRELSNKLTTVPGVRSAIVMLTDRNAYTAILIDNAINGTRGPNAKKETNHSHASNGTNNPALSANRENWRLATGVNNYETIQHQEDISAPFKQRIAITLRTANPLLHEVFISANRDFINQLNAYAIESNWGEKSLNYRMNEFNGSANRLFGFPEPVLESHK